LTAFSTSIVLTCGTMSNEGVVIYNFGFTILAAAAKLNSTKQFD